MAKQSIYKWPKRNKGFVLIYTLFTFIFTFTLLLIFITYYHYINLKTTKHYERLRMISALDVELLELTTDSSALKKVNNGFTTKKDLVYAINDNGDSTYTLIGYQIVNPNLKKYYIFHNGYYDKTDYDYRILEEGYIKEDE